jgi:hypothetical protein
MLRVQLQLTSDEGLGSCLICHHFIQVTQTSIVRFSVSGLQADGSGEEAALLGGAEQSTCANRFTSCIIVALISLCVYYSESGRLC